MTPPAPKSLSESEYDFVRNPANYVTVEFSDGQKADVRVGAPAPKLRGGKRPGSGRPAIYGEKKMKSFCVSLPDDLLQVALILGEGNKAEGVRTALTKAWGYYGIKVHK